MTQPGTPPDVTIDGAGPRDDVAVAAPDLHAPGQPPGGGHNDPHPNIVYASRRKTAAEPEGEQQEPKAEPAKPARAAKAKTQQPAEDA